MKIVSLVLKFLPQHAAEVSAGVEAVPGASVVVDNGDGRMIVLVEDGDGYAVSDSILQVHRVDHVMSVTLSYEYSDDAHAPEEALA
jgi:nitrate reductase NapD